MGDPGKQTDVAKERSSAPTSWEVNSTRIIGGLSLLVLAVGTVVYRILEEWSWVDSFYFSAVALTTVGFGDLSPTTDASKLFTVFYIFSGISLIGALLNEVMKRHARRVTARANRDD
jgi:hypothetical protein